MYILLYTGFFAFDLLLLMVGLLVLTGGEGLQEQSTQEDSDPEDDWEESEEEPEEESQEEEQEEEQEVSQEEQQLHAKDQSLANVIDRELAEFLEKEKIHSSVFTRKGLKRLSCFSHTLQLVVSAFNKHPSAKELLSNAFKVVKQASRSGKVTEALIAATAVQGYKVFFIHMAA